MNTISPGVLLEAIVALHDAGVALLRADPIRNDAVCSQVAQAEGRLRAELAAAQPLSLSKAA